MSDETFVAGPRFDYVCVAASCEESIENPWRDLPAKNAKCPKCGRKRYMQIVWNKAPHFRDDQARANLVGHEMLGAAGFDHQNSVKRAGAERHKLSHLAPQIVNVDQIGRVAEEASRGKVNRMQFQMPGQPGVARPTATGHAAMGPVGPMMAGRMGHRTHIAGTYDGKK